MQPTKNGFAKILLLPPPFPQSNNSLSPPQKQKALRLDKNFALDLSSTYSIIIYY